MNDSTPRTEPAPAGVVIRPVDPVMGAEIVGADLSGAVSDADLQRYKDALHRYKVIVFRDQTLTKEQMLAFSKRWGPLGEHIMPGAAADDYQEINEISNATKDGLRRELSSRSGSPREDQNSAKRTSAKQPSQLPYPMNSSSI